MPRMPQGEDEVFDEVPFEAAPGGITSLTDSNEDLGALLLRLIGGSMIALQMLNEAPSEVHAAVQARLVTLKSIVGNFPDKPVVEKVPRKKKPKIGFAAKKLGD